MANLIREVGVQLKMADKSLTFQDTVLFLCILYFQSRFLGRKPERVQGIGKTV